MKLEGTYTFEAARDLVWDVLQDPVLLAAIMPGCEGLEALGDDKYKTTLKIQVGPVQGVFEGTVALSDINKPDSYRMDINGKGAPGFVKGVGNVRLEAQGETTILHYDGDAQVGGRIASVGSRLLESSAKALTKQSLDGIAEHIKARVEAGKTQPSAGVQAPAPVVKPPSQTRFALGVAQGVLADLIPPERRPLAVGGGVALLALIVYVIVRLITH